MSRNDFKVMDSDMHVIEPSDMFEKYLDQRFRPWAPQISRAPGKRGGVFLFQGERLPSCDVDNPHRMYGMSAKTDDATAKMRLQGYNGPSQLEAMNLEGIDIAVMYPTVCLYIPNGLNNVDGQLSSAVCRAYNDWLYDLCQTDPQRMKVAAMVPQHDPKEAVKEAIRAVKELGAVGIYMRPNFVNGVNFHSADYAELWATLEELNIPVGFHEGTGSIYQQDGSEFGHNRLMLHACSHPIGMMKAVISMICGGVFENFPKLRAAYLEANAGWVPFWLGRMDRDYELYKDWDAPFLTKLPSEYFKSNCYVGTEADEAELGYTVDAIGNKNIVFSSDYPHHDSEFPESVNEFLSHEDISKETKQRILWDNCTKLYAI
ncbi:MAG: amidohydrolase [Dehalococcoidia bacterium]|jgi:predicted TIM-barrel fold metal-dependent hydrolase|nr:amidohydrolase [Dehalococcoidia bacterium]|tara:strand:- start:6259 stop:7380 length:1122 start_codon:yes stop_codon:yes gene_type:complete